MIFSGIFIINLLFYSSRKLFLFCYFKKKSAPRPALANRPSSEIGPWPGRAFLPPSARKQRQSPARTWPSADASSSFPSRTATSYKYPSLPSFVSPKSFARDHPIARTRQTHLANRSLSPLDSVAGEPPRDPSFSLSASFIAAHSFDIITMIRIHRRRRPEHAALAGACRTPELRRAHPSRSRRPRAPSSPPTDAPRRAASGRHLRRRQRPPKPPPRRRLLRQRPRHHLSVSRPSIVLGFFIRSVRFYSRFS